MGDLGHFSKTYGWIWFILLRNEDIIVSSVHAKFHVQTFSGSWDIGVKVVKNGGFRTFLEKLWMNLVPSPREIQYYSITCACQISCSEHFWFLRYWGKRGQKCFFCTFLEKLWMNLVHSPTESRYYRITCVWTISCPETFRFLR